MAPQSSIPPALPPSVEEAYRRKCVQLKNRTNDIEEANDAARLRLTRAKRQVEKLRIERAFLLEQLAKRTSTNVEDSDGSPSPPPTEYQHPLNTTISHPDANRQKPKDKPLRIKRGHRKTDQDPKGTAAGSSQPQQAESPAPSDAAADAPAKSRDTNGVKKKSSLSSSKDNMREAFELYCEKKRPALQEKAKDSDVNVEEELERGWKDLPEGDKEGYRVKTQDEPQDEPQDSASSPKKDSPKAADKDEDVEMKDNDAEEAEPPAEKEKATEDRSSANERL